MTIYGKLKTLTLDELQDMGLCTETAAQLLTGKLKLEAIARHDDFCTANIGRALFGDNDTYCEGISQKCTACAVRFLMNEWSKENEKMYNLHKVGVI